MGDLCQRCLKDAFQALLEGDRQLAYAVIIRDQQIDALESELGQDCLRFLVRHVPAGAPLRYAYGAIRASLELERVGDYAESIARQALKLGGYHRNVPVDRFKRIAELSLSMLGESVRAFASRDPNLAAQTMTAEETGDTLCTELNAELVRLFRDGKLAWEQLHPLMTVARRLERASDQARSLCLETIYACTGEDLKHPGAEAVRVLFVDRYHASLSPMAVAIGRGLNQARFVFASAGLEPRPVDPATIAFMRDRGFDLSRVAPRAVTEVPNLDKFDVVVALDPEAWKVFQARSRRLVCLEWPLADPVASGGWPRLRSNPPSRPATRSCRNTSRPWSGRSWARNSPTTRHDRFRIQDRTEVRRGQWENSPQWTFAQ
jgi:phosphate transport system protein